MRSGSVKKFALVACALVLAMKIGDAAAQQSHHFTSPKSAHSESMNGQIDWPSGKLNRWNGPIVAMIAAGGPSDRDGWQILATASIWNDRKPLEDLSLALVKQGIAVMRFDNPGVSPPRARCREAIATTGLSARKVQRCIDAKVLSRLTVTRYVKSIERAVEKGLKLVPSAHTGIVLLGFSESIIHATTLVDRGNLPVRALISIGSPVQAFATVTKWQGVHRVVGTLQEFDANKDGITSNAEITSGFAEGMGGYAASPSVWLSPEGQWDHKDIPKFTEQLEQQYKALVEGISTPSELNKLTFIKFGNGVHVPDVTNSFWSLHFNSTTSPGDVLKRKNVPALYMWGTNDRQIDIPAQRAVLERSMTGARGTEWVEFNGRHHMLSRNWDNDWFEASFAAVIATTIDDFISRMENHQAPAR